MNNSTHNTTQPPREVSDDRYPGYPLAIKCPSGVYTQPHTHLSAAEVRACWFGHGMTTQPREPVNLLTEGQNRFLNDLLAERDHNVTDDEVAKLRRTATRASFQSMVTRLKRFDMRAKSPVSPVPLPIQPPPAPPVDYSWLPEKGYYFVKLEGTERFVYIRADKQFPDRRVFKIFRSDDLVPVFNPRTIKLIVDYIETLGVEFSREMFAKKSEHCARCNKRLTDEESRARSYGPDCYDLLTKNGYFR